MWRSAHTHWIIFHSSRVRANNITHVFIHTHHGHRGWSVILPHKMLYFHRKNGINFVYRKIYIYLFDFTKLCRARSIKSMQNTRPRSSQNPHRCRPRAETLNRKNYDNSGDVDGATIVNCAYFIESFSSFKSLFWILSRTSVHESVSDNQTHATPVKRFQKASSSISCLWFFLWLQRHRISLHTHTHTRSHTHLPIGILQKRAAS